MEILRIVFFKVKENALELHFVYGIIVVDITEIYFQKRRAVYKTEVKHSNHEVS